MARHENDIGWPTDKRAFFLGHHAVKIKCFVFAASQDELENDDEKVFQEKKDQIIKGRIVFYQVNVIKNNQRELKLSLINVYLYLLKLSSKR